jgi:cytochrome c peroxidase
LKARYAWLAGSTAVVVLVAAVTALRFGEGDRPTDQDRIPAEAREEIKSVVLEIDRTEAEALDRAPSATLDRFQQITLLGKVISTTNNFPGVGGFLAGPQNPNREWATMAKSFLGKYKTPTLRNVDKRPRADFVKAYMHNGCLKSLKEVVHFYNTRDALPMCKPGDPGEKVTCWPAPENPETMNRKQLGDLKLSDKQEDLLVAFLKTLTDGYSPPEK